MLEGRTENSIKNFFYSQIRKRIRHHNKNRPVEEHITGSVNQALKSRRNCEILLANTKPSITTIKINMNDLDSPCSLDTCASSPPHHPNLSTVSLPSMDIVVTAPVAQPQPQPAMIMPANAFAFAQSNLNTARPASYKQMRPTIGLSIP